MDYNKQKEIFNKAAETWDALHIDSDKSINRVVTLSQITQGQKVLDVGCGTGVMDRALLETVGESGFVKAIDISPGMLSVAGLKFTEKNIIFCEENIETTTDTQVYDAIICNNVFPHFQNREKVLKNVFRLLKQGGIFTVSHLKGRDFVNNIHKEKFNEDIVPKPEIWVRLFEKYGFREIISLDEKDFYCIVMEK